MVFQTRAQLWNLDFPLAVLPDPLAQVAGLRCGGVGLRGFLGERY